MSPQIQFRAGQPQRFVATRTFDLGSSGLKVPRGSEILFDGTQVSYEGHPSVIMPQLRGALKVGWLVLAEDFNPNDTRAMRPVSAGMQVRPAEGGNPMQPRPRQMIDTSNVESEEREVRNVNQHAQETRDRNQMNYRRQGGEVVRNNRGEMEVIEDQEGVAVRGLKTPAKQNTNLEKTNAFTAIQEANSVRIDPGQGKTREDMMAEMDEESRLAYESDIMARKAAYAPEEASAPRVIGRVPQPGTRNTEGFQVRGSVGGGVGVEDLGGTGVAGKDQVTVVEAEGLRFTNTNGPKKQTRLVPTNPQQAPAQANGNGNGHHSHNGQHDALCRQIARSICTDFPDNYGFTDPVRKKIARLQADYDDRPDIIRAVAAADTDPEVRQRLIAEFPHAFGG